MVGSRLVLSVSLTLLSCLAACSSSSERSAADERIGHARTAIINGTKSTSAQDAVVLVAHVDSTTDNVTSCTGTLLAPNLVLTARHCVSNHDDAAVVCNPDGTPKAGGALHGDYEPGSLYVFTGAKRPDPDTDPQYTLGKTIIHDDSNNVCNHDVALLVLEKPIENAQIAPIRLDGDVHLEDRITAVGFGMTETSALPDDRLQRTDVEIRNVGPDTSIDPPVPPNELVVNGVICGGDSGSPAFDQDTNAVVGVASRDHASSNSADGGRGGSCVGATDFYEKTAAFKDVIMKAFDAAGAEPWLEGDPDPRKAKLDAACSTNDDCQSALCVPDPSAGGALTCAGDCTLSNQCSGDGMVCTPEGEHKVCRVTKPLPPQATTPVTTCATTTPGTSGVGGGGSIVWGLVGVSVLLRSRRRSRSFRA